jgi:hypothetical protein
MLQLISIAMFALMGFSPLANAAPTHSNAIAINESPAIVSAATIPNTWNHQDIESILSARISKAMEKDTMIMVKRANEDVSAPLSLDTLFRSLFDNVINHIIEITPLNDIVHGNYDLLYQIFLGKVQEILTGAPATVSPAPSDEVDSEYNEIDEVKDDENEDEQDDWKHSHEDEDEDEDDE